MSVDVALTFDDGPDPKWTPRVLAELDRLEVQATFFLISVRAHQHPRIVETLLKAAHGIGLHGAFHLDHETYPADLIAEDTDLALRLLPLRPNLWRPPYGHATAVTEHLARKHNLRLTTWTADSGDWQAGRTAADMLVDLEPQLRPGAVVLMHDANGPGATRADPSETVALIDALVHAIRRRDLAPGPLT